MHIVCTHCLSVNRVAETKIADAPSFGKCKMHLMTWQVHSVDEAQLQRFITRDELPVVVDFWAPWCGPCLQFAPVFSQVAGEFATAMRFLKLDTQQHAQVAATWAIRSIPTLILFQHGREVRRLSGALPKQAFTQWLQQSMQA